MNGEIQLELIWNKYGWDGMQRFLIQAADDTSNGFTNNTDEEKTAYWVENMSKAYGVDFSDLISHWGFSVSEESRVITSVYPKAEID